MLHLIWSAEESLLQEQVQAVLADLKKKNPGLKEFRIDPDETELSEIPVRLRSLNLFGEASAYFIPLLDKKRFDAAFFDALLSWGQGAEHHHAFVFGVLDPFDHPLWTFLENRGRLHKVEAVRKEEEWRSFGEEVINRFLDQKGIRMAPEARRELLHRCYMNPERLKSELGKLCDFVPAHTIDRTAVERMVNDEFYEDYALLKALQERDARILHREMRRRMEEAGSPDMILATLANEVRFYLLLKSVLPPEEQVLDNRQFVNQIFPKLKPYEKEFAAVDERYARRMKNGWALYHAYKALAHYSARQLRQLLQAVSRANVRIRQGVKSEELLSQLVFILGPKPKGSRG